jgi:phosphoglycolate phosphatase-like HAD superfamily hydrolase
VSAASRLREARLVFWDFDGVIKQSVEAKTHAFVELFRPYGVPVSDRVRVHHLAHGGVSRFEKMPHYLEWAGLEPTTERVADFCARFAAGVRRAVLESPWVPGVERLLRDNPYGQRFIVVSGTPQDEMEEILRALTLRDCFEHVYGAPTRKEAAMRATLAAGSLGPDHCLAIGDAGTDLEAASANAVPFLLVRHASNAHLFEDYQGESISDFTAL